MEVRNNSFKQQNATMSMENNTYNASSNGSHDDINSTLLDHYQHVDNISFSNNTTNLDYYTNVTLLNSYIEHNENTSVPHHDQMAVVKFGSQCYLIVLLSAFVYLAVLFSIFGLFNKAEAHTPKGEDSCDPFDMGEGLTAI